jgi:hypothetical protein
LLPMIGQRTQSRAWYEASITDFLQASPDEIMGRLATNNQFALLGTQRDAWIGQLTLLKQHLTGLTGSIFLEFNIPRVGRRIDVVLIVGPIVFVIEFKVGEKVFDRGSIDQVWDYGLDLKNFHEASHTVFIVPLLVATEAESLRKFELVPHEDGVYMPIPVSSPRLREAIDATLRAVTGAPIDALGWSRAPYKPTPTIIEAARALYARHSVEAIARSDADAQNLATTSLRIEKLVDDARARGRKLICFVTGVPGAGKTLVGLNVATRHSDANDKTHAVFLSGNGPLVAVLREALIRDEVRRKKEEGIKLKKSNAAIAVKAFIQNIHHFRDEALVHPGPPSDHVAIFDEAQRAWNLEKTVSFMRQKKGIAGFSQSEPEFLISCMDRHEDWAVVICLVGGGQDINTGEAGIDPWLDAVASKFQGWEMYISSELTDSEYAAGRALEKIRQRPNVHFDNSLHLAVSMRSFRAEHVSTFVKALLDCEVALARNALAQFTNRYPIAVTRNLDQAKGWVRARARGTEQYGLLASSKAQRLKPHAIDIRVKTDPVCWFLNEKEDTRSSYYLEDAATEFQVQGLEVDWACVTWDGDLRYNGSGWNFHDFRGDRWTNIASPDNRRYLLNAYRVLLTRARQGMVLFVPKGDSSDLTRSPQFYDATFNYLVGLGIPTLS